MALCFYTNYASMRCEANVHQTIILQPSLHYEELLPVCLLLKANKFVMDFIDYSSMPLQPQIWMPFGGAWSFVKTQIFSPSLQQLFTIGMGKRERLLPLRECELQQQHTISVKAHAIEPCRIWSTSTSGLAIEFHHFFLFSWAQLLNLSYNQIAWSLS